MLVEMLVGSLGFDDVPVRTPEEPPVAHEASPEAQRFPKSARGLPGSSRDLPRV